MKIQLEVPDVVYTYLEKHFAGEKETKTKDQIESELQSWLLRVIENRAFEAFVKEKKVKFPKDKINKEDKKSKTKKK